MYLDRKPKTIAETYKILETTWKTIAERFASLSFNSKKSVSVEDRVTIAELRYLLCHMVSKRLGVDLPSMHNPVTTEFASELIELTRNKYKEVKKNGKLHEREKSSLLELPDTPLSNVLKYLK